MNEELFHKLYAQHSAALFSYLLARTSSRETAADLLQELFLKVWNRIDTVARIAEEQQRYWLFSLASNGVIDHYRRSSRQKQLQQSIQSSQSTRVMPASDLSELLAGREQFRELEAAILKLPEEQRCILLMTVVGEMTSAHIGTALGIPAGTVRYKLFQARQSLSQQLGMLAAQPTSPSVEGRNRYG